MRRRFCGALTTFCILCSVFFALAATPLAFAWSNGGRSSDPSHPKYGTHDWIAEHAMKLLPSSESKYISDNYEAFLYGTEMPDFDIADQQYHHVYFSSSGSLSDDSSARRADEEFQKAVSYLRAKDYVNASREAGIMSHYVSVLECSGM